MKKLFVLSAMACLTATTAVAQTGADYIEAYKITDCTIPFDVNAEGKPLHIKWGMDTAWDWNYNVNRGIAHLGKGLFETGRVSFQPIDLVTDNGDGTYTLSARQQNRLKVRINLIKTTGTTVVNLNCDHEVLFKKVDNRGYCTDADDPTGKNNYNGKPEEWYKLIKASVQYCQAQGLKVVSVSPFNEPDYTSWQQYTGSETNGMKDFLAIAKLIKADPFFKDIRVCGGNTLNCDRALPWYNSMKDYLDEGNTHQLAGSFDNYVGFFKQVAKDGKVGTADELHNVGEAIVGAEYGMTNGIWWGFDALARGQFMHDSNEGVRLGYGEDRAHWTSSAVYRNDKTNEVHGFIGTSERQANKSSYRFVSTTKPVFFNGYGPTHQWVVDMPGGTGYQKGQINAEKVFDITWGADVAPMPEVKGTYMIVNAYSKKPMTYISNGTNIQSTNYKSSGTTQQWAVTPGYTDGDCSYWFIDNAGVKDASGNLTQHLNLQNLNLNAGAGVITYNANHVHEEQWYIKYAKDGYYYIIARLSNKYLTCGSTTSGAQIKTANPPTASTSESELKKYLWRFQPTDSKLDFNAPAAPTALKARQRTASIELSWTSSTDEDVVSYTIIRGEKVGENVEWNTVARQIEGNSFMDNNVTSAASYIYKVVAVDKSGNRSAASEELAAQAVAERSLVQQLQFDVDANDATANQLNAKLYGGFTYQKMAANFKSGAGAIYTNDGKSYVQLPYNVANHDEMTIALWVKMASITSTWQRIFDFGNDQQQYMFLCPNNGSEMRFVMKNKGDEQILSAGRKLAAGAWHHIAITIAKDKVTMYYDGEEIASSTEFTIRPSDIAPVMNYLGRSQFPADPYFKGYLDDFRIYNYPLSADEVKAVVGDLGEVAESYKDSYVDTSNEPEPPTGINGTEGEGNAENIYNLGGVKMNTMQNGINIVNGKKVLKK